MEEEMIDVEVNLGAELAKKVKKASKTELVNRLVVSELHRKVQLETIDGYETEIAQLKEDLYRARYKQRLAEAMVNSVIDHC